MVTKRLLADEFLRDSIEETLAVMTDSEFLEECEALFVEQSGLRRLYGIANRGSVSLRLCLVEFLCERERKMRRDGDDFKRSTDAELPGPSWNSVAE